MRKNPVIEEMVNLNMEMEFFYAIGYRPQPILRPIVLRTGRGIPIGLLKRRYIARKRSTIGVTITDKRAEKIAASSAERDE